MKKVLLISNRVMHYRVSIYNYFAKRFNEVGWDFIVRSDQLQKQNPHEINFDFREIPFRFSLYKREITQSKPDAVIIFLHLKNCIIWPLLFWLKSQKIPVVFWTKGANLDNPNGIVSRSLYKFTHASFDRLILYSRNEMKYIHSRHHHKVHVANNTLNFEDFPEIKESKEEIKKGLGLHFDKVVLAVGRMNEGGGRKKLDHLIRVFEHVNSSDHGLVVVGAGVNDDLQAVMNRKNIIYLGEIYDPQHIQISRIFKMADVFSLPGHVGLGLNQAFYWGLPVVTEEGSQPPEINYLVHGRNGFIVPNNNLTALKDRIFYLLTNDTERNKFSANAREDILKHGSIQNMFEGFKSCLDSLGLKPNPDPMQS